jgi:DNA topoisomerase-1
MSKNLVIVESPAKAKTIEKYLGKDYQVLSSIGHIRSIAKKVKGGGEPIEVKNGFKTTYQVDPEKKKVITELKRAVKTADTVWLATDEDREGEAIGWHLCEVLGLDPAKTKRIVFHEITKAAIEEAIKSPRTLDMSLVEAQQARQILDRIVGFELSPVVWQKVPGGKSAGRVQSPAVRLLVEREREIDAFEGSSQFKVTAEFVRDKLTFKAELPKRFDTEAEAQKFLEGLTGASFSVSNVTTSPATRNPGAPYTTSTLQQDANSRLGFSAKATMSAAQKLYQEGKITYMRTDSVNLSKQALGQMTSYITTQFGKDYHQIRTFKTKSASAQEAHEAIRPTDVSVEVASSNAYDQKLYDLIRRRALASQMAPAKLEKTTVKIAISTSKELFEAKGEVVVFDGYMKVYGASKKDPEILPPLQAKDVLVCNHVQAKEVFARPPARYTEGSLVKKLEELGIGRPSTYATIISTVQARGYAIKGEGEGTPRDVIVLSLEKNKVVREVIQEKTGSDKGKLLPTPSGQVLNDFLVEHFDRVVDYGFTAEVEKEFDEIAAGVLKRNDMLQEFYDPFHALIDGSGKIDRAAVAQAREIGIHPKTKKPIVARFGKFGPMLQMGATEDKENKPSFAPLPEGKRLEDVTLEDAVTMFTLPREVGKTTDGEDILANIGPFGPYVKVGKLFVSIKPESPFDISLEKARELVALKQKAEAEKYIQRFTPEGIDIVNGRYGAYITDGKKNAKIPKDVDPKTITLSRASELLAKAPDKKSRQRRKRT